MSNLTKAESNRINAAKSTGPKTPEGLAVSSMNAIRHGLTAKTVILKNEDPNRFIEMLTAYYDCLLPASRAEASLVSDIVAARWRLRRVRRYETAMLDKAGATHAAVINKSKGLSTALRCDVALARTYRQSLEQFRRLRSIGPQPSPGVGPPRLRNEPEKIPTTDTGEL